MVWTHQVILPRIWTRVNAYERIWGQPQQGINRPGWVLGFVGFPISVLIASAILAIMRFIWPKVKTVSLWLWNKAKGTS